MLIEEALTGNLDLRNWPEIIEKRDRAYVTDARSVFDYLQRDATSTSTDKRMAIEGALLRETVKKPKSHVRWMDGQQNFSDVLTKATADKEVLRKFLKDGYISLVQTPENAALKERKREERHRRKKEKAETESELAEKQRARREKVAREVADAELSEDQF